MQGTEEKTREVEGGLVVTQRRSGGVVGFAAEAEGMPSEDAAMGGYGGVHISAFAE
jgi:hypothetical protein